MSFKSEFILSGLSQRQDGSMKLLFDGVIDTKAVQNREIFFERLGVSVENVVSADLVHGVHVAVVTEEDRGHVIPATDGLVTDRANVVLVVTVADCVPIYFFDSKHHAVGIAHSGWKGTLRNIASEVIRVMRETCHSDPKDIHVWVGPHIQAHHFEVKGDVIQQFQKYGQWILEKDGHFFIDLGSTIQEQLLDAGLLPSNIELDETCTYCDKDHYFSYRRDKPEKLEVMVAYIELIH